LQSRKGRRKKGAKNKAVGTIRVSGESTKGSAMRGYQRSHKTGEKDITKSSERNTIWEATEKRGGPD